jgi:hypothetical protein
MTIGIVLVAFFAARVGAFPDVMMISIELPLRISVLDGDVLSIYVAKLAQTLPNCLGTDGLGISRESRQIPYPRDFLRLLRLGRRA